ncbi:MAG TPA: MFS transporter [Patescibacteria group bacterium]|nr:MFS transporter [Patescibacteria group bacterium]
MSDERKRLSVLEALTLVRGDERAQLALAFLYFFCVLGAYYVLRPIRDAMGIAGGTDELPWLFLGTLILTLIISPIFSALVARMPRARFVTWSYRGLMLCLLGFFAVIGLTEESQQLWVGRIFYWWTSVYSVFAVSLFWAVMSDVFTPDQGRRLFAVVSAGGTLGGLVGAGITSLVADRFGILPLLIVSALLLEIGLRAMRALSARAAAHCDTQRHRQREIIGGSALAGFRLMIGSPYLLGIAGFMALYTIGSTFLYFLQADIVATAVPDRAARSALFAQIDVWANAATLLMQVFVSAHLLNRFGIALALCVLPLLFTLGYLALGVAPVIGVVIAFQSLRRMGNFALTQPARENLYFPLPRESRYKAKNLIDTFMFRAGDQIGAWTHTGLGLLGLTASGISFVAAPISALWLVLAIWLGRAHRRLVAAQAASSPSSEEVRHEQHPS